MTHSGTRDFASLIFIVGSFRDSHGDPREATMHGLVRGGDAGVLDAPVFVRMSERADGNRLIRDLIHGSAEFGVAACRAASVIELRGCSFLNDDEVEIDDYRIISSRPTAGFDLPEPPDGFTLERANAVLGYSR